MSLLSQKTLNSNVKFNGIGLHTGKEVSINILPSEPNTGILFKRTDLKDNNIVVPNVYNVSNATLCTTISNEYGVSVSTIEHLMGALYGLGIDNALIEINSQEVPILDGSAKNFVEKFLEVGFKISEVPIKLIKILNKIQIEDGSKYIEIDKSNVSLDIDFEIKYMKSLIGNQKNKINVYENDLSEIYNSRTFCLYEDVEKLRNNGLAKGGSLDNAIVVQGDKVLNKGGLRSKKEFVNHKILDLVGDFMLFGARVIGSIECIHGGHALTNEILKKIFSNKNNYDVVESQSLATNVRKIIPLNKRFAVNA